MFQKSKTVFVRRGDPIWNLRVENRSIIEWLEGLWLKLGARFEFLCEEEASMM